MSTLFIFASTNNHHISMQIKGIREAFYTIIKEPNFANKYGTHNAEISLFKSRKLIPSINKLEAILAKVGATVVAKRFEKY